MLRTNPLKAALAAGQVQMGTWINLVRNPAVLVLLKSAGLDYARLDMEHSSPSIETVADMAVLGRALEFPLVVRPPRVIASGSRGCSTSACGACTCRRLIIRRSRRMWRARRDMRHSAIGAMAGLSSGHRLLDGRRRRANDWIDLNEQVHVTAMLESAEAFRHLDGIVAPPGIDAFTIGPTDLAQDLGVFGTSRQAEVLDEHRERLIATAQTHGKDVADAGRLARRSGALDRAQA